MIGQNYIPISEEIYEEAYNEAFSIGSIENHEVGYRAGDTKYIGSVTLKDNWIFDFYRGPDGRYWHERRKWKDGRIISEEEAIFGHKIRRPVWKKE